jgi:hypothetical protein
MSTWLRHDSTFLAWENGLRIDVDGAPNAYGPNNTGLDYTANAGKAGNWYGVVTDKDGDPYIQGPEDPYPGDYISATSLQDHTKAVDDPTRYVDARTVPYLAIPKNALDRLRRPRRRHRLRLLPAHGPLLRRHRGGRRPQEQVGRRKPGARPRPRRP